jgi:cytoskeletal protein RodZ
MQFIFKKKNIIDASVGEILAERRKQKKISLDMAAAATKISVKYLAALETGNYETLPDGIYARNFLREYGYYLGLNCKYLLKLLDLETNLIKIKEQDKPVFSHQRPKRQYFFCLPKIMRNIILLIAIAAGFIYLGLRIKNIVAPPLLIIDFPAENYTTAENKIVISGQTESEARLFINGRETLSEKTGKFTAEISLKEGLNIISVKARKQYGKEAEVIRQVLVKPITN